MLQCLSKLLAHQIQDSIDSICILISSSRGYIAYNIQINDFFTTIFNFYLKFIFYSIVYSFGTMLPASFLKIYLPLYFVAYLLLSFVLPSWRTYRQTGINPVTFGKTDNAHDYIGLQMKVFTALLAVAILLYVFGAEAYRWLVPILYLAKPPVFWAGLVLMHLSLGWIMLAQYQMGQSWRIGIDEANTTELKREGLFGLSRNPIFLGMIVSLLGLFLVLPNILTAISIVAAWLLIQIQVRLEEEFLHRQHGAAYEQYKNAVRRWL